MDEDAWFKKIGPNSKFFKNRHLCYYLYNTFCLTSKTYQQGVPVLRLFRDICPLNEIRSFLFCLSLSAVFTSIALSPHLLTTVGICCLSLYTHTHIEMTIKLANNEANEWHKRFNKYEILLNQAYTKKINMEEFEEEAYLLSTSLEALLTSNEYTPPIKEDFETQSALLDAKFYKDDVERMEYISKALQDSNYRPKNIIELIQTPNMHETLPINL